MAELFLDKINKGLLDNVVRYLRDSYESSNIDKRTTAKNAILAKKIGLASKQVFFLHMIYNSLPITTSVFKISAPCRVWNNLQSTSLVSWNNSTILYFWKCLGVQTNNFFVNLNVVDQESDSSKGHSAWVFENKHKRYIKYRCSSRQIRPFLQPWISIQDWIFWEITAYV